jgi:hypothetical protein
MRRILTEPEANLIRQHQALMTTEGVTLEFTAGRHRGDRRRRRGGERLGREHRRPAAADHPGARAGRDQLLRLGKTGRGVRHHRRLCARKGGRDGGRQGSVEVHSASPAAGPQEVKHLRGTAGG